MDATTSSGAGDSDRLVRLNRLATTARLVAGLAHELNNALQVIGGVVELLADRQDLPADVMLRLQRIGGQSDRAVAAVRQVLGYSRELPPDTRRVNVGALVEQVLALRRYQLGRSAITAILEQPETGAEVRADERLLAQAVMNLVLNAEEALAGQAQRQLRVAVIDTGGTVQIRVEDTGAGVPPDLTERIFEPYFTTKASERAVGLGLPVSRAIAERFGGTLRLADSAPGASFVMEVPLGG